MDWLRKLIGHHYLLNMRSAEVHDLKNLKKNCKRHLIADANEKYLSEKDLDKLRARDQVNGCRWCMPHLDKDKRKWRKPLKEEDLRL